MKNKFLVVVFIMLGLLSMLFGCKTEKAPEYPFEVEKAFYMSRSGIMAGGSYSIKTEPEGRVEVYSYIEPVPDGEDGMRDKGASIYFVGLEPGEVTVTVTKHYPTCPDVEQCFVLVVAEDLSVTKKETE